MRKLLRRVTLPLAVAMLGSLMFSSGPASATTPTYNVSIRADSPYRMTPTYSFSVNPPLPAGASMVGTVDCTEVYDANSTPIPIIVNGEGGLDAGTYLIDNGTCSLDPNNPLRAQYDDGTPVDGNFSYFYGYYTVTPHQTFTVGLGVESTANRTAAFRAEVLDPVFEMSPIPNLTVKWYYQEAVGVWVDTPCSVSIDSNGNKHPGYGGVTTSDGNGHAWASCNVPDGYVDDVINGTGAWMAVFGGVQPNYYGSASSGQGTGFTSGALAASEVQNRLDNPIQVHILPPTPKACQPRDITNAYMDILSISLAAMDCSPAMQVLKILDTVVLGITFAVVAGGAEIGIAAMETVQDALYAGFDVASQSFTTDVSQLSFSNFVDHLSFNVCGFAPCF